MSVEELRKQVWEGRIIVQIELSDTDIEDHRSSRLALLKSKPLIVKERRAICYYYRY